MKPNVARRAAGRVEKPGGRNPDWPGLSRRLFGMTSLPPERFSSPCSQMYIDSHSATWELTRNFGFAKLTLTCWVLAVLAWACG